ncbi:phage tail fiber-like protein [Aeromonas salmonicida]|uniref:pyocin knob domain-containing protein n=1 Tax=Aeromonas salmonicida TaxID=645 RepID=UPI000E1802B0|nr:pyocin knob domain-containing protein [Aeromonas salmonicida]SUU74249.1 phage tail fiber-like protein [Aeromonas salmonicida]
MNHFSLTLSVPELTDYLDANGHQHHVAKVAIVNANGSVTDVRRKRTIELTGDVTGKGILEDAQGVTIAVEIKDGSHRHKWNELDQVPATASRWPSYSEVTNKPDLAAANHTHRQPAQPINLAKEDLTIVTPGVYAQNANANTSAALNSGEQRRHTDRHGGSRPPAALPRLQLQPGLYPRPVQHGRLYLLGQGLQHPEQAKCGRCGSGQARQHCPQL